jgi:acetyl esterase/lipase
MNRTTIGYGTDRSQVADLHLPASNESTTPLAVVVVIHGGFWGSAYGRELGTPLADDLAQHGVAGWNIEYRRLGNGGGWPSTFDDVGAAIDALATLAMAAADGRLDLARVVAIGHSAGGHLAVWAAGRAGLPPNAPGADPRVRLTGVVSQAGVLDLAHGAEHHLGGGAVPKLLGGSPHQFPDRYAQASPYSRLPIGVPATLVHGLDDDVVPIEQSDRYKAAAEARGDRVDEIRLQGVGHYELIDVASDAWARCRTAALGYVAAG